MSEYKNDPMLDRHRRCCVGCHRILDDWEKHSHCVECESENRKRYFRLTGNGQKIYLVLPAYTALARRLGEHDQSCDYYSLEMDMKDGGFISNPKMVVCERTEDEYWEAIGPEHRRAK